MKFSIVVSVFNVAKYLDKSLHSILAQTFGDWEAVVVDDGSTDYSPMICDNYVLKDSRIKVIHKSNGGLSSARNAGINASHGEYVLFLDGDDYYSKYALEILNSIIIKDKDLDFVQFRYKEITEDEVPEEQSDEVTNLAIEKDRQFFFTRLIELGGVAASACTKLIRRNVLDTLSFKEGMIHEDEDFTTRLLSKVDKVAYCDNELYYYVYRKGSIVHNAFSPKKLDAVKVREDRIEVLKQFGYYDLAQRNVAELMKMIVNLYLQACDSGCQREAKILSDKYKECYSKDNPYVVGRQRLLGGMSKYCDSIKLYGTLRRILKK